jgi:hypothetical protein
LIEQIKHRRERLYGGNRIWFKPELDMVDPRKRECPDPPHHPNEAVVSLISLHPPLVRHHS